MKETTTKLSKIYFFSNFETDFADIESHIAVFEKMSCRFRTQKTCFFLFFCSLIRIFAPVILSTSSLTPES
ncbi:MAG: hypothetical protein II817_11990 [Bacteroidales bacterium]|nr:hypothetical protein [Bacteroidales bacterium]